VSAVPSIGRPRDLDETAEFFKVSKYTVRRRIKAGLLECSRSGRMIRVSDEQIEAFLARTTVAVAESEPKPARNPKYAARAA
jgi:excisionase family DNA binding protein